MVDWPLTLPQLVDQQGYTESPPNIVIKSSVDAGPAKIRRRFTSGPRPINCGMILSAAEIEILDDFYINDIASGSLAFNWVHPRTQAAASFRFTKPPSYSPFGAQYQVAMELEIMP
jgi:hypothetical protein